MAQVGSVRFGSVQLGWGRFVSFRFVSARFCCVVVVLNCVLFNSVRFSKDGHEYHSIAPHPSSTLSCRSAPFTETLLSLFHTRRCHHNNIRTNSRHPVQAGKMKRVNRGAQRHAMLSTLEVNASNPTIKT